MAQLTYRHAGAHAIRSAMSRDERVILIGEDVQAGGVFNTAGGLYEEFGPHRVRNTPISEQAILGAAMGAAMTGLIPIAELMFADFAAVCFDMLVNQIPKFRYMSGGQLSIPLVVRAQNGAGLRFGAQHSQNIESWLMPIPGIKVVVPSTPQDVVGLLTAAIWEPDPVLFLEHKELLSTKGDVPDGDYVHNLGTAKVVRSGSDVLIITIGAMVARACKAARELEKVGVSCTVLDLRSLVPLDIQAILDQAPRHDRIFTVEENPRPCGWGAEVSSLLQERVFDVLLAPIVRLTMPYAPVPAASVLEDGARPSVSDIVDAVGGAVQPKVVGRGLPT